MKLSKLMLDIREKYGNDSLTARKLKLSRQTIFNISDGTNIPKDSTIITIADELGLKVEPLLIQANIERSKGDVKKVWEQIEKKLSNCAAALLAFTITYEPILSMITNTKRYWILEIT